MTEPRQAGRTAAIALGVFAVAIGSAALFRYLPSRLATPLWKASWLILCFGGLRWAHHMGVRQALQEVGLTASISKGVLFGFAASLAMLAVYALAWSPSRQLSTVSALMTAVLTPVCEEVLFRGYLFLQLYRRAGWSFGLGVGTTAAIFGLAHLGGLAGRVGVSQVVGEVGMVAAGGIFYAWLLLRWHQNLWVPIALHGFMNLWCETFACDEHPGNWHTNAGRALTVAAALILTALWRLRQRRTQEAV